MKLKKTKPPKDREFLGVFEDSSGLYYGVVYWWKRSDGNAWGSGFICNGGIYIERDMLGWVDLPNKLGDFE